jgi:hypothetical protein
LPGELGPDHGDRSEFQRQARLWFGGCALVVLVAFLTFVVYIFLLVHGGAK